MQGDAEASQPNPGNPKADMKTQNVPKRNPGNEESQLLLGCHGRPENQHQPPPPPPKSRLLWHGPGERFPLVSEHTVLRVPEIASLGTLCMEAKWTMIRKNVESRGSTKGNAEPDRGSNDAEEPLLKRPRPLLLRACSARSPPAAEAQKSIQAAGN